FGFWTRDNEFRRYMREAAGKGSESAALLASISSLPQDTQWLVAQKAQLHEELAQRDAQIAKQKAWIGKLEEGKQWLAARNEQLQREIDAIKRSRLWRILHVIGLNPGSRQ